MDLYGGFGAGILQPLHLEYASEDHMFDCFQRDVEKLEARNNAALSSANASESDDTPRKRDSTKIYPFPVKRVLLTLDFKEKASSKSGFNGYGVRIIGGKMIPGERGEIGAFVAKISSGPQFRHLREALNEGDRVLEWNGVKLGGKTFEDVQKIVATGDREVEMVIKNEDGGNFDSSQQSRQRGKQHLQQRSGAGAYEEVRASKVGDRERNRSHSSGANYSRLEVGNRGAVDEPSRHYASDNEADRNLGVGGRHAIHSSGGVTHLRLSSSLYDNVENSPPRSSYVTAAEKEAKRLSRVYSPAANYANPPMQRSQQQPQNPQQMQYNSNTESSSSSPLISHYSPSGNRGGGNALAAAAAIGQGILPLGNDQQQQYYRNAYNAYQMEQVSFSFELSVHLFFESLYEPMYEDSVSVHPCHICLNVYIGFLSKVRLFSML